MLTVCWSPGCNLGPPQAQQQPHEHTHTHTNRETDTHKHTHTNKQTRTPTQTNTHTHTHTHCRVKAGSPTTLSRTPRCLSVWAAWISPGLPTPCCWSPPGRSGAPWWRWEGDARRRELLLSPPDRSLATFSKNYEAKLDSSARWWTAHVTSGVAFQNHVRASHETCNNKLYLCGTFQNTGARCYTSWNWKSNIHKKRVKNKVK